MTRADLTALAARVEAYCAERGWLLRGHGGYCITGIDEDEANAMTAALNEREDGDHGQQ